MNTGKSETSLYLQRWNEGDQEALNQLLENHLPWLRAQVRRRLGPLLRKKGESCDFVQDSVVQFIRYGPRFTISSVEHFRALLLRIIENALRNQHDWYTAKRREIARERPLPSDTVLYLDPPEGEVKTPSRIAARHEQEAWVRMGLEFLDPKDREVLILRQWDKLSLAEIGERFGISLKAAWMRHNRALKRLGDKIWELRSGNITRPEV